MQALVDRALKFVSELKKAGLRVTSDTRDNYTPGWKYNQWELKASYALLCIPVYCVLAVLAVHHIFYMRLLCLALQISSVFDMYHVFGTRLLHIACAFCWWNVYMFANHHSGDRMGPTVVQRRKLHSVFSATQRLDLAAAYLHAVTIPRLVACPQHQNGATRVSAAKPVCWCLLTWTILLD